MTRVLVVAPLALLLVAAACGPKARRGPTQSGEFECKERRAEYVATGGLLYAESGVRIFCDGDRPLLEKYYITAEGEEMKRGAVIPERAWEEAWQELESAGWRFLDDCDNPAAAPRDPINTFEISNGDLTRTFVCPGIELPFPYDRLRNALDLAAGELPPE